MNTNKVYTSKYGEDRHLQQINETEYLLYGYGDWARAEGDETIEFIEFDGGPMIGIGESLMDWTSKDIIITEIKSVYNTEHHCFKLITEKK